jgi:hypothetical protein
VDDFTTSAFMQANFNYNLLENIEKFNIFDIIIEIVFGKYLRTIFKRQKIELQKDFLPSENEYVM